MGGRGVVASLTLQSSIVFRLVTGAAGVSHDPPISRGRSRQASESALR